MSGALVAAIVASLWHGALVACATWAITRVWRPSAAVRCGLATAGLWAVALWFVLDLVTAASATPFAVPASAAGPWTHWVAAGWGLGVALGTLRIAGAWWCVARWRARALALDEATRERFAALAVRMGLSRPPQFATSDAIDTPMVVGVLRPLILLPSVLLQGRVPSLSAAQIEALVAHELSHLARADPWFNAIGLVIEIALFHNPAVWWLGHQARLSREQACDDRAVEAVGNPIAYARALLQLRSAVLQPALPLSAGGALQQRVARLVRPSPPARPRAGLVMTAALAVGLLCAGTRQPQPPVTPDAVTIAWLPATVMRHEREIVLAAQRHGLDPNLLAIVTMVESGGDASAVSPIGAKGLMQLMPQTASQAARQRGLPPATPERLADPAYNLDLGAWVLARELQAFGRGDDREAIERAAAAYNAGAQRARDWLDHGRALPDETEAYRARVGALWAERDAARLRRS